MGNFLLYFVQLDDPFGFDGVMNIIGVFALGDGPFALRIFENERGIKAHFFHHINRFVKLSVGLGREPDDDVGCESDMRNEVADFVNQFEKFFTGVGAIHHIQNSVAARLQRKMNMFTCLFVLGDGLQQFLWKIFGVRGRETDPFDPLDFTDGVDKIGKILSVGVIGIDVLA